MSGGHDEIDEVVCAGGSGTTLATSCLATGMQNWDPTQNYMVLMSKEDNEYDQGGTSCAGTRRPAATTATCRQASRASCTRRPTA